MGQWLLRFVSAVHPVRFDRPSNIVAGYPDHSGQAAGARESNGHPPLDHPPPPYSLVYGRVQRKGLVTSCLFLTPLSFSPSPEPQRHSLSHCRRGACSVGCWSRSRCTRWSQTCFSHARPCFCPGHLLPPITKCADPFLDAISLDGSLASFEELELTPKLSNPQPSTPSPQTRRRGASSAGCWSRSLISCSYP